MKTTERDTYPFSELPQHAEAVLMQVDGAQNPIYLTVGGESKAVLLSINEFERLRDLAALASEDEGIRQGEEDVRMGRVSSVKDAFDEIRQTLGLAR